MSKKKNLSRITIDVTKEEHQKFKAIAAFLGKSMRELITESIQEYIKKTHTPMLAAMKNDNNQ